MFLVGFIKLGHVLLGTIVLSRMKKVSWDFDVNLEVADLFRWEERDLSMVFEG